MSRLAVARPAAQLWLLVWGFSPESRCLPSLGWAWHTEVFQLFLVQEDGFRYYSGKELLLLGNPIQMTSDGEKGPAAWPSRLWDLSCPVPALRAL